MHVKQSWSIHFWLSWPNSLGNQVFGDKMSERMQRSPAIQLQLESEKPSIHYNYMNLFSCMTCIYLLMIKVIFRLACQPGVARAFALRAELLGASRLWQAPLSFLASRSLKPETNSRKDCSSIALVALPGHSRFARLVRVCDVVYLTS